MKFTKIYVFLGFHQTFKLKKYNFSSKEKTFKKTYKYVKEKPKIFEKFLGLKFTKLYVFLGLRQTFKLKKNTIF